MPAESVINSGWLSASVAVFNMLGRMLLFLTGFNFSCSAFY